MATPVIGVARCTTSVYAPQGRPCRLGVGVLRRAIDEAALIARSKRRMTGKTTLADDPRFQYDLAMAESTLSPASCGFATPPPAEQHAIAGGGIDPATDNDVRQSTTFLTQRACVVRTLPAHRHDALRDGPFQQLRDRMQAASAMVRASAHLRVRRPALAEPEA